MKNPLPPKKQILIFFGRFVPQTCYIWNREQLNVGHGDRVQLILGLFGHLRYAYQTMAQKPE